MALCDISTGYLFLNQLDSALYYAQAAYEAGLADSVPRQLPFIYTNLGSIYSQQGEPAKALDYINKSIALRPAKDTARILSLYGVKLELLENWDNMIRHITIFRKLSPVRSLLRWPTPIIIWRKYIIKWAVLQMPILCYNALLNYPIPYESIVILRKPLHCKSFTNTNSSR